MPHDFEHANDTNSCNSSNHAMASHAMRITLISQTGTIHTLWLPNNLEGRYRFQDTLELEMVLPIYVEAENGNWVVHLEKGAFFRTEQGASKDELPLCDELITKIYYQGKEFALYAEINRPGDGLFFAYKLETTSEYQIGRDPNSHIHYANDTVSWQHAVPRYEHGVWQLIDRGSTNGTYVNGRRVDSKRLETGDIIYIMGLYILVGSGFISMNNANDRVRINSSRLRRISDRNEFFYPACEKRQCPAPLFDRQPRRKHPINPGPIKIDMPPMSLTGSKIPMLLRMGNPMVMGGRAIFTGNYVMALTSLVFPALTQGLTEKDRKEYESRRYTLYREYLAGKEREIYQEKCSEELQLNEIYPELSGVLNFTQTKERLWERRNLDEDFLDLRVGTGSIPMLAELEFPEKSFAVDRDELQEEMYNLAERPVNLENVPITLSLKKDFVVGVHGESGHMAGLLRNLTMQLVMTHSYDEVKLVLLMDERYSSEFDFARYLPHNWDNDHTLRFFAETRSDVLQISEYLSKEIEKMMDDDHRRRYGKESVSYVILAFSKRLFDCMEILKDVLRRNDYIGVSIIAAFDGMPKECSRIIDLSDTPTLVDLAAAGISDQTFMPDPFPAEAAQKAMREIMYTKLMVGSHAYALPNVLTFLEMFGAGKVEHLNPLRRWEENNPVKSLSVPIGVGTDGRSFNLDLHEKHQGPHGLVAGMTGSGKSEFLITYILSMAVNFSPDEVAFILIDYKGGGLADAFENKDRGIHLPHIAGTITNLDGASIDRSLMSIKSELIRRQTVFKEVKSLIGEGTLDIYDYQKLYRAKKVTEPLPHLFIISDEFAELKQQQPMFMDELISAARIGRSLGVHLILATQKPGGVVNNQIWSNTKFRACLRVQDRADSMEMLKRPEAAELKHTGRFYLQVGYNEYFAMGQSAWCGADYVPQDEVAEEQDNSVQFLDNTGQTILSVKPETEKKSAESHQIVAVVQYLSDLAKQKGIRSRSLWKPALPAKTELGALLRETPPPGNGGISALIGIVDDPERQDQFPFHINLLELHNLLMVGNAGSGKSTFIRTMLYALAERYSPEELNYYILDLSDGALSAFERLPHCGAYLTERQTSDWWRLMNLISSIVERRKRLLAEAEVESFEAYCKTHKLPLIVFVVDGFTKVKGLDGGDRFFMKFTDYLREGTNFGIRYVVTCNHINEVGAQSRQEMDCRIALQAKDHYEYSDILKCRCKSSPPELNGRGMCVLDGRALSYHTAMLDADREESERPKLLRQRLEAICRENAAFPPAERLPMVDFEQSYAEFCAGFRTGRIPLGYSTKDMKPVAIPFQQYHSLSVYFGNPKGVRPVFQNLLTAARMNGMETFLVCRDGESVFDDIPDLYGTRVECSQDGLTGLMQTILQEISARNVLRDEYSVQHGIPLESKGRSKKAAHYIREHSKPLLVIIESFMEFCGKTADSEELNGAFTVFFSMMRGYNIYFAAGFYADDEPQPKHPLAACYNPDELLLLSGGRYNKIPIKNIPYEITKLDKTDPLYNQFTVKYRENIYTMIMPCGNIQGDTDPDEASIF